MKNIFIRQMQALSSALQTNGNLRESKLFNVCMLLNTANSTTTAVPSNLGEEIRIGSSVYVWVHRSERLNKIAEMYERVYHFEKIDEEQGNYQLLKFTEDYTR